MDNKTPLRRHTVTAKQLAANRANAKKAGRPKGKPNLDRRWLGERVRKSAPEIFKHLMRLARHGESHAVQLAAARELLDRGYGRPMQVAAVEGESGPVRWIVSWATSDDECREVLAGLPPQD
jgi:hypothetical protein